MDLNKLKNKAKDTFDKNRDKAEDLAEKGVKTFEDKTGKQVPDSVKKKIDEIDPNDNVSTPRVENTPGTTAGDTPSA